MGLIEKMQEMVKSGNRAKKFGAMITAWAGLIMVTYWFAAIIIMLLITLIGALR